MIRVADSPKNGSALRAEGAHLLSGTRETWSAPFRLRRAPRLTPEPAGSGRAQTLPRWLLPHTDGRQPKGKRPNGARSQEAVPFF